MPFSNSSLSAQVKSYLTFLPEEIRQKILNISTVLFITSP